MPAVDPTLSARAQLASLAAPAPASAAGGASRAGLDIDEPPAEGARPAAVLILFGVLDTRAAAHDPEAEPVSRDLDVLLLSRATTLRSHPGQVAFPGGRVDAVDDGPVATALREAQEETGLDPAGVEVLGTLENIPLAYSRHLVTPVLAWWRKPSPVHVVDVAESSAVFRAPVADLLNPSNRGVTVIRRDGQTWSGAGFLVPSVMGEHLVWGFTAMVLDALFDRLGWTEPWDATRELPIRLPGYEPSGTH